MDRFLPEVFKNLIKNFLRSPCRELWATSYGGIFFEQKKDSTFSRKDKITTVFTGNFSAH